mmetsp:Transcript_10380/g.16935  ORF Transcript_10380/g.16935 Transcript_10380/m.16935 type:complete len:158 (+) Transcript_10380:334-807(+)
MPSCRKTFSSTTSMEDHYRLQHMNVCSVKGCKASYPDERLLNIHIREVHDIFFQVLAEKRPPQYECLVENCEKRFNTDFDRGNHLHAVHKFPKSYRFNGPRKVNKRREKRKSRGSKAVPCRFFFGQNGCKFASTCRYSHEPSSMDVDQLAEDLTMEL